MSIQRQTQPYRILLIDDNPSILADYRKILDPEEEDVTAGTAAAAFFGDDEVSSRVGPDAESSPASTRPKLEVTTASQGDEGIERVSRAVEAGAPYALAFVDMRMPPGLDGLATVEALWAIDPHLQTVICSAYSDATHEEITARLGDSDRLLILRKPFDNIEVSQIAAALTAKWDAGRQVREHVERLEQRVVDRTGELEDANVRLREAVRERTEAEARMRHAALHDALTGLPNRTLLHERLERFASRFRPGAGPTHGVLFLDLDNFKVVNDGLGHATGDRLLMGVAQRLVRAAADLEEELGLGEVVVARLGGDEFVLGLEGLCEEDGLSHALAAAELVLDRLAEPFHVDGRELHAGLSIGFAVAEEETDTPAGLLRDADTALYLAKGQGRGRAAAFSPSMRRAAIERLELESDLRLALDAGEFWLAYQPIVNLSTGRLEAAEALLRWSHPTLGLLGPDRFIPLAEETGLIVPIGRWVLEEACRRAEAWGRAFPRFAGLAVTVNVSTRQLLGGTLAADVEAALAASGLTPERLRIEITEGMLLRANEEATETFARIRGFGVGLLMDDFGTGYSSLSALHRMPVDGIKLDASFVRQLGEDRSFSNTVQAIVTLASNRNLVVVAEGIERVDQLVQLQAMDCSLGQGYHFGKPMRDDLFEKLLLSGASWRRAA